ncbi:hypothetical protein AERO9A_460006 [Aeromonas salmonicida]|nr:hypothetical protein AERO9A_460006 [Aeromonas salmonicida]
MGTYHLAIFDFHPTIRQIFCSRIVHFVRSRATTLAICTVRINICIGNKMHPPISIFNDDRLETFAANNAKLSHKSPFILHGK